MGVEIATSPGFPLKKPPADMLPPDTVYTQTVFGFAQVAANASEAEEVGRLDDLFQTKVRSDVLLLVHELSYYLTKGVREQIKQAANELGIIHTPQSNLGAGSQGLGNLLKNSNQIIDWWQSTKLTSQGSVQDVEEVPLEQPVIVLRPYPFVLDPANTYVWITHNLAATGSFEVIMFMRFQVVERNESFRRYVDNGRLQKLNYTTP